MKALLVAAIWAIVGCNPAVAAETLLTIVRLDGTVQQLTDADMRSLPVVTLTTPLVGHPDDSAGQVKIHQAAGPLMRDVLERFSIKGTVADAIAIDA